MNNETTTNQGAKMIIVKRFRPAGRPATFTFSTKEEALVFIGDCDQVPTGAYLPNHAHPDFITVQSFTITEAV